MATRPKLPDIGPASTQAAKVHPNHYSPPGPIGNTQGKIVPDTEAHPGGNSAPPIKPTEKEKSWWQRWGSDVVHTGLDIVGLIPGVGEVADGANALIYLAEGDKVNAAISAAAMVPGAGMAATGAKLGKKAVGAAAEGAAKKAGREATEAAAKKAEREAAEKAEKELAERKAKSNDGGKDKNAKPKPKCGGRATYARQAGDFAGNAMERDHVPSFAALKKALLKYAKDNGHDLDETHIKTLFGETSDANRTGDGGKLGRHAQTIAVPDDVHKAGRTHGNKNNPNQVSGDSGDLQGAAKKDNQAHRKNIKNDKHKDCAAALNQAADEIDKITNDQYEKFFEKLIQDTLKGKNTADPWKGIL